MSIQVQQLPRTGRDAVRFLARTWVREQGLHEGQSVDLARLRAAVIAVARRQRRA